MEDCKTFKPFLEDIIDLVKPKRIQIELSEIPIKRNSNINLRKKTRNGKPTVNILCLTPDKENIYLQAFLDMLKNETYYKKRIHSISIICDEDSIQDDKLLLERTPVKRTKNHYIFGQFIYVNELHHNRGQLTNVILSDLSFEVYNLKTTKTIAGLDVDSQLNAIKTPSYIASSLPF